MQAFIVEGEGVVRTEAAAEIRTAHEAGKTLWLDVGSHTSEVDALLADTFKIHPLAIEDLWAEREQPKVEDFGDYVYALVHSVHTGKRAAQLQLSELDLIVGKTFVLTHAHDPSVTNCVADELRRSPRLLLKGPAWLAHAVLDRVVDDYMPLLDAFDDELHRLETDAIDKAGLPEGRAVLARIFATKRAMQTFRRVSTRQREILLRLSRAEFDEIPADAVPFFRDVYDHFARVSELVESYRELLASTLDAYLSVQANRMNEVMKTLTLMSTVMLPLTFIAGVYGMNFEHMPELKWPHGYPFALGLMAFVAAVIVGWFRHKRWL